jgi:cellulose synthase/poly-beta-1,6-N-acetylglucosamine synthase-like glycosyltransferase
MYYYFNTYTFHDYKLGESFDIFELVKRAKANDGIVINMGKSALIICDILGIKDFSVGDLKANTYNYMKDIGVYLNNKNNDTEKLKIYPINSLDRFPKLYHQSWIDDGITIEAMEKFNIRYYPSENEIVIPCYNADDDLIGIRARNVDPTRDWKYLPLTMLNRNKYNFKFPTGKTLYGLNHTEENIERIKKVMLFEAEKSVLQCEGYLGKNNIAVAKYGSNFTEAQRDILLKYDLDEVIICNDFDYKEVGDNEQWEMFEKKVYKIGDMLRPYVNKVTALVEYGEHPFKCSPIDMGKEKLFELIRNREELY